MGLFAFNRMRRMQKQKKTEEAADKKPSPDFDNMTVKELKAFLDEKGVEYPKKAKKDELIELAKGAE